MLEAAAIAEQLNLCEPERIVSQRSLRSLDWLNFFKADVLTTVGPYLAIFLLASRHMDIATIGLVMSVPGLVTMLTQTPAGALIDWIEHKRTLVMLAACGLGAGCLLLVTITSLTAMLLAQGIIAIATIVMPPAVAAISIGLVGHDAFAQRMGRNEAYSHTGAAVAAVAAGLIAYWTATIGLFYLAAVMSIAAATVTMTIREQDIDLALAREAKVGSEGKIGILPIRELLHDSRIAIFALAVVLFHLANAAMLPLLGEMLSTGHPVLAVPYMSACIIIAQLVMTPIALTAGRLADSWGRKPVFLIGFAALLIRGLLFTLGRNPYFLVSVQILDGVGAGIFGVLAVIVVSDLAQHTGRFNLMQGAMNTCVAIGGSLSNLLAGIVADRSGYRGGFILLTVIAFLATAFFWTAMPETGGAKRDVVNRG